MSTFENKSLKKKKNSALHVCVLECPFSPDTWDACETSLNNRKFVVINKLLCQVTNNVPPQYISPRCDIVICALQRDKYYCPKANWEEVIRLCR